MEHMNSFILQDTATNETEIINDVNKFALIKHMKDSGINNKRVFPNIFDNTVIDESFDENGNIEYITLGTVNMYALSAQIINKALIKYAFDNILLWNMQRDIAIFNIKLSSYVPYTVKDKSKVSKKEYERTVSYSEYTFKCLAEMGTDSQDIIENAIIALHEHKQDIDGYINIAVKCIYSAANITINGEKRKYNESVIKRYSEKIQDIDGNIINNNTDIVITAVECMFNLCAKSRDGKHELKDIDKWENAKHDLPNINDGIIRDCITTVLRSDKFRNSKDDLLIILLRLAGFTYTDISKKTKRTVSDIQSVMKRLYRNIRKEVIRNSDIDKTLRIINSETLVNEETKEKYIRYWYERI